MSTPIGSHGLSCIGDDDYAAYALSMQCNAQALDAALASTNEQIGDYADRGWISVVSSSSVTVDSSDSSGTVGPDGILGEEMDTNGSGAGSPLVTRNVLPGPFDNTPATLMPRGIYLVGSSINWTLGALTANSYRQLSIFGVRYLNGTTNYQTNFVNLTSIRDYQGDGGASGSLTTVGLVDGRAGDLANFVSFFDHGNTASDLVVAAANWRLWVTYLGSGLVI
jgi:hypothetical protein